MSKNGISLLPQKGLEGTSGRLVDWLLSVGRYIIIFTELIVIGAFLSRFWLDRKNSDLSEEIRQEKAILESTAEFEKEFRLFQARLSAAVKDLQASEDLLLPLKIIEETLPKDTFLIRYGFSGGKKNEIGVLVLVFSEESLAEFVSNILSRKEVSTVKIGTIERKEGATGIRLQLLVGLNKAVLKED